MKQCTSCGAFLEDKAMFCTKCGASLKDEVKSSAASETDAQNTNEPKLDPKPIPKKASEKKKALGVVVKILSIILSIQFCVVLFAASLIGIVRNTFDPDMIVRSITAVDIEQIEEIKVENDKGKEVPIAEYILDFCNEDVKEKYGLDEDKIIEVIKDTKADEFLGEILADYASYFIEGDELREIDGARVVSWIRNNEEAIESVVKYEFKEKDYQDLEQQIDNSDIVKSMSKKSIEKELDVVDLSIIKRGLSLYIYITMIVLACAVAGLVVAINRKKIRALFTYIAVSVTVTGAIFLLVSGSAYALLNLILPGSDLATSFAVPFEIITPVLESFVMPILIRGAIMFGVGLIASIVYKIVSSRRRAKA